MLEALTIPQHISQMSRQRCSVRMDAAHVNQGVVTLLLVFALQNLLFPIPYSDSTPLRRPSDQLTVLVD